jgi:hypothetical protein
MPDLRLQLFVERRVHETSSFDLKSVFDDVVILEQLTFAHRPRFEATLMTDLEEAAFIDGDTFFIMPMYEVFELLEHYDIAATLAPVSYNKQARNQGVYDSILPKVSEAQREWNTGLIVARVDDRFRGLMKEWMALFGKLFAKGLVFDQAPFRSALATSSLRVAALPENYNFRANIPRFANGAVKMLHAHGDLPAIAAYINKSLDMRLYVPKAQEIHGEGKIPLEMDAVKARIRRSGAAPLTSRKM